MKDPRRLILLILALTLSIVSGTVIVLGGSQPQWSIMLRAGILLGIIWLAMPEMSKWSLSRSWPFLVGAGILAITIVSRPRLVPFAIGAFVVILTLNFVMRKMVRALTGKDQPR